MTWSGSLRENAHQLERQKSNPIGWVKVVSEASESLGNLYIVKKLQHVFHCYKWCWLFNAIGKKQREAWRIEVKEGNFSMENSGLKITENNKKKANLD